MNDENPSFPMKLMKWWLKNVVKEQYPVQGATYLANSDEWCIWDAEAVHKEYRDWVDSKLPPISNLYPPVSNLPPSAYSRPGRTSLATVPYNPSKENWSRPRPDVPPPEGYRFGSFPE